MVNNDKPIILLDLNYTLVENSEKTKNVQPFPRRVKKENYRKWLFDLIKDYYVILITARPARYVDVTLESVQSKLDWLPDEYYFNELDQRPPTCKERILNTYIFPAHGETGANYFGIESNPQTKKMYATYGIPAISAYSGQYEKNIVKALHDTDYRHGLLKSQGERTVKRKPVDISQKTLLIY